MADRFEKNTFRNFTIPAIEAFAITPSNDTDLPRDARVITISGAGIISYINWEEETVTTGTLHAGSYPLLARRVLATGTTATNLTGWY
jgi:hypothetical protein